MSSVENETDRSKRDRLGPGSLCCSACTWTNISSSNKIQRNYKELKITMHERLGQIMDNNIKKGKKKKKKIPILTSEEMRAKAEQWARHLRTPAPKEYTNHLGHPSDLISGHTPTLTKEQIRPSAPGSEQGNLLLVLVPPPIKPCLHLFGLLLVSID